MAIIARTHIPDGNPAQAEEWNNRVGGVLAAAHGFIAQADGPATEGGWQIFSIWESRADLERYFESAVKPYLPPDAPMAQEITEGLRVLLPNR
jgi:hypothetical protein